MYLGGFWLRPVDAVLAVAMAGALPSARGPSLDHDSDISTGRKPDWEGTVDIGLMFSLTENIHLDCGCNFGVTSAADVYNPFIGLTWRF